MVLVSCFSSAASDRARTGPDPTVLVLLVPPVDHRVQLGERRNLGHRDEVVATEPADLPLDPALLVGASDSGLAVERFQAVVGAKRGPALGLDTMPGEAQHLGDRSPRVVVRTCPVGTPPSTLRAWTWPSKNAS